jgi:two-component system chemotaxis response regulator CheB
MAGRDIITIAGSAGSADLLHYRCHVGHAYTAEALIAGQDGAVEEALWAALRTLEETAALRRRLAEDALTRKPVYGTDDL